MCIYSWVFNSTTSLNPCTITWREEHLPLQPEHMICGKVSNDSTVLQSSLCALCMSGVCIMPQLLHLPNKKILQNHTSLPFLFPMSTAFPHEYYRCHRQGSSVVHSYRFPQKIYYLNSNDWKFKKLGAQQAHYILDSAIEIIVVVVVTVIVLKGKF